MGKAAGLAAVRFVNTAAIRVGDGLAVGDASVGALGATRSGLSKVGDATVGLTTNTINATVGVVNLSVNAIMMVLACWLVELVRHVACPHPHPAVEGPPLLSHQLVQTQTVARSRRQAGHRELELDLSGWNSWSRSARAGHEAVSLACALRACNPSFYLPPFSSSHHHARHACASCSASAGEGLKTEPVMRERQAWRRGLRMASLSRSSQARKLSFWRWSEAEGDAEHHAAASALHWLDQLPHDLLDCSPAEIDEVMRRLS